MVILKILLVVITLVIIPTFIGMLFTNFMKKEKNNLFLAILIGYFTEFAIYEALTIPFTFAHQTFNSLIGTCTTIFCLLTVISIILNIKNFKEIIKSNIKSLKETPKILGIIALCLISIQCFVVFKYMHIDEDDSNFVAKATIMMQTNTLYVYSDSGRVLENYSSRRVLSPFPVFTGGIAKLTGFHPMFIAHTVFPVIFIILVYIAYFLMGKSLFKDDKRKSIIFLIFINLIYIFGDFSLDSNFRFMLVRLWQGKAILCNLIIPSIIMLYDRYIEENGKFIYWLALFMLMYSSCLVSTMGFALAPVMLIALTMVYLLKMPKIKYPFMNAVLCFPNIVYSILYIILKEGEI